MALLTKDEAYNWLKVFLKDGFELNDTARTVRVSKELTKNEFDGILCDMLNLIGNKELPHPKDENELKSLYQNFKLDPNRIPVDGSTLKINKYGLLEANIDSAIKTEDIVEGLLHNEAFLEKIKEYIQPELGAAYTIGLQLLHSPAFLRMLTSLVTLVQTNDNLADGETSKYVDDIIKEYFTGLSQYGDQSKSEVGSEESTSEEQTQSQEQEQSEEQDSSQSAS